MQRFLNNLLLAAQDVDAAALFGLVLAGVVERRLPAEHTGEDAEQGQLADERVSDRLVDERGEGLVILADAGDVLARARVFARPVQTVVRRGREILRHQVEHTRDAHARCGRHGDDRHNRAVLHALAEARLDFLKRQFARLEVLFHQLFVRRCRLLNQVGVAFHQLTLHVFGHRHFDTLLVRAFIRLAVQHVHHATEGRAFAQRQQNRHDAVAVLRAQLRRNLVEVRVIAIHLVDNKHAPQTMRTGVIPRLFRADGQSADRVDDDNGRLHHAQRADHFAHEVKIARYVHHVDNLAVPVHGGGCSADGALPARFFGVEVRHGRAVFHTALTIH